MTQLPYTFTLGGRRIGPATAARACADLRGVKASRGISVYILAGANVQNVTVLATWVLRRLAMMGVVAPGGKVRVEASKTLNPTTVVTIDQEGM